MPELPEVEVVRRGLEAHVLGLPIRSVEVLHPRPVRRHLPGPDDFATRLTGHTFTAARRRGKYLWLALDGGDALLGHLGMSGQMLVQPPGAPDERHLRVRFSLGDVELRFVDQRMFGGLTLSDGGAGLPPEIAHIARDPMDEAFDDAAFVRRVRRSDSGIKRLLLNQGSHLGGRQHLRRRGALARARARRAPGVAPATRRRRDGAGRLSRGDAGGARPGRHLVRRALRQRQRAERLLRPLPEGLRTRGSALPALRYADPPHHLHEPVLVLLPGVPARPSPEARARHLMCDRGA